MVLAWHPAFPCGLTPRGWPAYFAAVMLDLMSDVTRILSAIEQGDPNAASQLLPLVYDELRQPAARKQVQEAAGQALHAPALAHDAHLLLVDVALARQGHGHARALP